MSEEIKVKSAIVKDGLTNLQTAIQTLNTSFSKVNEGQNKLDVVHELNEIIREYNKLLSHFQTLFIDNIRSTEEAVNILMETEEKLADDINIKE